MPLWRADGRMPSGQAHETKAETGPRLSGIRQSRVFTGPPRAVMRHRAGSLPSGSRSLRNL